MLTFKMKNRPDWMITLITAILTLAVAGAMSTAARAQGGDLRSGELNPFPQGDVYRLHLVGDWFVAGLGTALPASLRNAPRIQIQNQVIEVRSIRQANWDQGVTNIRDTAASTPIDIAVVMLGASEFGSLRIPGRKRLRLGSDEWRQEYATRVDSMMKALKANKGAVYWIGLSIVRRQNQSEAFQLINAILRERAYANQVTFIDSFSRFQNENGEFSRSGPDISGATKRMRNKDGVSFTSFGYAKLAHLVSQMIRRDLSAVKAERVVTLAGSETEQRSIRRDGARPTSNRRQRKKSERAQNSARFTGVAADHGTAELRTTTGNRSTTITLKLPRPPLSAAVISLVTRNQSKDRLTQFGDNAVQVLAGGVPLLSTVTPANQSALALRRRRLSPTQSVFFKVWGKGERLEPKPGRADDFQWPRPEPKPVMRAQAKPREPVSRSRRRMVPPRDPNLPPLPVPRP